MEQLLEIIYQRFKSGDLKAGEDLYNMCREAMKTDVSLGVKWLKILSEDISTQMGLVRMRRRCELCSHPINECYLPPLPMTSIPTCFMWNGIENQTKSFIHLDEKCLSE